MMGYHSCAIPHVMDRTNPSAMEYCLKELERARDEGLAAHELARKIMKDRVQKHSPRFWKGQQVWLKAKNLKLLYAHRKLASKCEGPFQVLEVMGPATYWIKLPQMW